MNTINFLKSNGLNGITDASAIREKFRSFGINVSFENNENEERKRFIFTSSKQSRFRVQTDLVGEANGLILEAFQVKKSPTEVEYDWEALAIPPLAPLSNVNTKAVNKFIENDKYDIYYIEDGTIINLYFHKSDNKWVFSTLKGIEVNDKVFNNVSYKDMFNDVLNQNHINARNFYKGLDITICYTFGFKHPDIHPFMENKKEPLYRLWFIQYVSLTTKVVSRTSPWNYIFGHKKIVFSIKSIGSLYNKLNKAYETYLERGISLYGFLLVSKSQTIEGIAADFGDDKNHANILLESTLMKYIKNLWYDASYTSFSKDRDYNRNKTILINSFLDNNRIDIFNKLFPQYADTMNSLVASEISIIDSIYDKIKKNNEDHPEELSEELHDNDILNTLCKQVTDKLTLDSHVRPKQKVREIIHTIDNIDYYYRLLT
ncbi:MAG: hypothetical protein ACRCZI_02630 [Cetobacterium sp.]